MFIEAAVNSIKHHLVLGSFFASVIIFIFLANWRTTLIASIAIPTSIISAFALMAAMGLTLNQITMLALTLMVGIVIDDAIIVLENIFRFMEEKGMGPCRSRHRRHARNRPRRHGHHALAACGVPAGRLHGRHRGPLHEFVRLHLRLRHCGIAAGVVHADPDAYVALREASGEARRAMRTRRRNRGSFSWIDRHYTRMLKWSMAHRRCMLAFSVLTVLSIVPLFMFVGKNFLPTDDQSQFNVLVRTPEGTSLAATTALTEQIAADIRQAARCGPHALTTGGGTADRSANNATIYVKLTDIDQRIVTQVAGDADDPPAAEEIPARNSLRRGTGVLASAATRATPKFSSTSRGPISTSSRSIPTPCWRR